MKKIKIIVLSIMLTMFFGCTEPQINQSNSASMNFDFEEIIVNDKENYTIMYESGIDYDKEWKNDVVTYTNDVVPTKETALEMAIVIFNGMEKSHTIANHTPQYVFFDEEDEVWVISFLRKDSSVQLVSGNDCSIAIQKKDGKVLRIWFGE